MGGTRRQGPRQSACPLRRLARRAPRRDRVAADQGDRQVGRRCGARGAAADHDPVVLHQDDGEGAGTGGPAGVAAVPGDQEGHRALPAAPGRRHHRAVELPGGQRPDGRHRRAGGRLLGPAQAVRAHAADRGGAAARLARLGRARGAGAGAGRPRGVRGRRRQRRLHPVHRIERDRRKGDGTGRAPAHAGQPRARRQGPDDRAGGRRRRPRRARRGVGRDVQRGPDVCVGRAGLCARSGLRPVRRRRGARRQER